MQFAVAVAVAVVVAVAVAIGAARARAGVGAGVGAAVKKDPSRHYAVGALSVRSRFCSLDVQLSVRVHCVMSLFRKFILAVGFDP